jgi:hypothetical protein
VALDDFVPGLIEAFCEPGDSEPVEFGKFIVPKTFRAIYLFTDRKDEKWIVTMTVSISDLGTPVLDSVEISGNVTRTKLKIVEEYRYLLLELSLKIAIKTRVPQVMLESEYSAETVAIVRALSNAGVPNNNPIVMDITELDSLPVKFVRYWDGRAEPLTRAELQELNKTINTALRRSITPEYLQHIANIYTQAVLEGKNPIQTIMDSERVKHRTASDYATRARAKNLLPDTAPGVVTIETPKSSTTGQKRKGKNGK